MIAIGNLYVMSDMLEAVAKGRDPDVPYDLYWKDEDRPARLDDMILVAEPVAVSDDDKEIYPESASSRGFWIYCSGELVQDVVGLAMEQMPAASADSLLSCVEYYIRNDDYLDLLSSRGA